MPSIQRAASALGVDPRACSRRRRSRRDGASACRAPPTARSSHNLFGIKAGDEWSGARATADSMEVINGVATPRRTTFRAYGSIEESVNDFASLLKNSPRYKDVIAGGRQCRRLHRRHGQFRLRHRPGIRQ